MSHADSMGGRQKQDFLINAFYRCATLILGRFQGFLQFLREATYFSVLVFRLLIKISSTKILAVAQQRTFCRVSKNGKLLKIKGNKIKG